MDNQRSQISTTADAPPALLSGVDLTKKFAEFVANDHINLSLRSGKIHALLGENGAGKSTLVKMLYGSLQPSAGTLYWQGQPIEITSPKMARQLGIGMVFQHFSLFDGLSVAENIALAIPPGLELAALAEQISRVSADYGLALQPQVLVADLSVGERQRVEIVRCLAQSPKLLIMDEPSAVLTPQEAQRLFETLRRLASEGCAIAYITHRLEEVQQLCDEVTILRRGKVVASVDPKQQSRASLAKLMVGAEVNQIHRDHADSAGAVVLQLEELTLPTQNMFGVTLQSINLTVRQGEVVAIAGIAGNGQSELFAALSGESPAPENAMVRIDTHPCGHQDIRRRRALNAAFIPEERLGHGAVPDFLLSENVILTRHSTDPGMHRVSGINHRLAKAVSAQIVTQFDVRAGTPDPAAAALSGGNLQKFVVGRELNRKPRLVVVNQPTWGVDAGAAQVIRQSLVDLATAGTAVVVISQDLDEIFEISTSIVVLSRGRLSEALPTQQATAEEIGLLMSASRTPGHAPGTQS